MSFEKDIRSISAEVVGATEQAHIDKIVSRLKDIGIRFNDQASRLEAAKDIIKEQHSQIQSLENKLHKLRMESL
jgi:archaellum component FlaC